MVSFPPSAALGQNINTSVTRGNSLAAAAQLAQINPESFLFNNLSQSTTRFDPFSLAASTLNASRPTALGGNGALPSAALPIPGQVIRLGQQSPVVQAAQQAVPPTTPAANPFATALIPPAPKPQSTINAQPAATKEEEGNGGLFGSLGKAFGGLIDNLTDGNGEGASTGANIGNLIDGLTGVEDAPSAAAPAQTAKPKNDDDEEDEDDDIDIDIDI